MSTKLNAHLLKQLECPICSETCQPPIYMCTGGHHLCTKCRLHLEDCLSCLAPGKPSLRCLSLEEVWKELLRPCKNPGCVETHSFREVEEHAANCPHREFPCPLSAPCSWLGKNTVLEAHVLEHHPRYPRQCGVPVNYMLAGGFMNYGALLKFDGNLFDSFFHYDPGDRQNYMYVRFLGPQKSAARYKCEFTFLGEDGVKKASFVDRVLSYDQELDIEECMHMSHTMTQMFVNRDKNIKFSVSISKI